MASPFGEHPAFAAVQHPGASDAQIIAGARTQIAHELASVDASVAAADRAFADHEAQTLAQTKARKFGKF